MKHLNIIGNGFDIFTGLRQGMWIFAIGCNVPIRSSMRTCVKPMKWMVNGGTTLRSSWENWM